MGKAHAAHRQVERRQSLRGEAQGSTSFNPSKKKGKLRRVVSSQPEVRLTNAERDRLLRKVEDMPKEEREKFLVKARDKTSKKRRDEQDEIDRERGPISTFGITYRY